MDRTSSTSSTRYTRIPIGQTVPIGDSGVNITFGEDSRLDTKGTGTQDTKAPDTQPAGTLPAGTVPAGMGTRGWIKACKTLGAGMGTGLSWAYRPVMARIATDTLAAGGAPPWMAKAGGLLISELAINPLVIGMGTTTAELISNRMQRVFTESNLAPTKSPDFARDLGDAIGVGFTTMAFALAYQGASRSPQAFEDIYYPALLGGAVTGAMAALVAVMGKEIRQLDALMHDGTVDSTHDMVIEGPRPESKSAGGGQEPAPDSRGERLCRRLRMSSDDQDKLATFFKDRVRAAFEMNREMVFNFIPVIGAQIILAHVLPMMNPAADNIFGLQDSGHMSKETQYALASALAVALVHNKRVEGWTSYLTGNPTDKGALNRTEPARLARQLMPMLVNAAVMLGSAWIADTMASSGVHDTSTRSVVSDQMSEWGRLGSGGAPEVRQVVSGVLSGLLLLRMAAGSGEGPRMRELVTSGVGGALAGATLPVPFQAGALGGVMLHTLVAPTHPLPDLTTKQGWRALPDDGAMGYGRQVIRPLKSMATGAIHAITTTRKLTCGVAGGTAGGMLLGGAALAVTAMATGGLPIPIAVSVGASASGAGSLLGMLAAYCRRSCAPVDTQVDTPEDTEDLPDNEAQVEVASTPSRASSRLASPSGSPGEVEFQSMAPRDGDEGDDIHSTAVTVHTMARAQTDSGNV